MSISKKISAVTASAALVFTGFSPAMAAPIDIVAAPALPIQAHSLAWNSENEKAERYRGNRGYRGYRGYRGHRHRRHRGRVNGGDILAGILVIGGIAAIASAASKNKRDRRDEDREYRQDDRRYDERQSERSSDRRSDRGTASMDTAINVCSNAAERQAGNSARIEEIRSVARDGNGWRVEGELSGAKERTFLCGSTDGRVDFVQLGSGDLAYAN